VVQDPEALIVIGIPFVTKLCLGTAITVIVAVLYGFCFLLVYMLVVV
jgi:hypothetical protein